MRKINQLQLVKNVQSALQIIYLQILEKFENLLQQNSYCNTLTVYINLKGDYGSMQPPCDPRLVVRAFLLPAVKITYSCLKIHERSTEIRSCSEFENETFGVAPYR